MEVLSCFASCPSKDSFRHEKGQRSCLSMYLQLSPPAEATKHAQRGSHRSRTQADSLDAKGSQFANRGGAGHSENIQRTAKIRNESANRLPVENTGNKDTVGSSIAIGSQPF